MASWVPQKVRFILRRLSTRLNAVEPASPPKPTEPEGRPTPFEMAAGLLNAPIRPEILDYIAQMPAQPVAVLQDCLGIMVRDFRAEGKEATAERLLHFADYLTQLRHEGRDSMMRAVEENWHARAYDALQMMLYSGTEDELVATVIAYHDTLRDTNAALRVAEDLKADEKLTHLGMAPRLGRLEKIAQLCEHKDAEAAVAAVPPPVEPESARAAVGMMRDSVVKKALMRLFEAPDAGSRLAYLRLRRHILLTDVAERRLDLMWEHSLDAGIDGEALGFLQMQREILYECRETGIERAVGCAAPVKRRESLASPDAATTSPVAD